MPDRVCWSSSSIQTWAPQGQGHVLFPHGPDSWVWPAGLGSWFCSLLGLWPWTSLTFYLESGDHNTTHLTEYFWELNKKIHVAQGLEGTPWVSAMVISVLMSPAPGTYLFFEIQYTVIAQQILVPFSRILLWQVFLFTCEKLRWYVPLGLILREEGDGLLEGV